MAAGAAGPSSARPLPAGAKEIPFVETAPSRPSPRRRRSGGICSSSVPSRKPSIPTPVRCPTSGSRRWSRSPRPASSSRSRSPCIPCARCENLKVRVSSLTSRRGRDPRRPHRRAPGHLLERRLPVLHHGQHLSPHAGTAGARHGPHLARRRVPAVLADGPCPRRREARPLPGNGHRLGRRLRPGRRASRSPCASSASACRRTRPSTSRPISTCGTRPSTRDASEAFIRQAADNDYQAMVDFGLDMLPTLYLGCEDGKRIVVRRRRRTRADAGRRPEGTGAGDRRQRHRPDLPRHHARRKAREPLAGQPAAAAGVLRARHRDCSGRSRRERKAKGWPEFICCPIDEVDASCKEFGAKVYAAVKAAGVRTYATKDPDRARRRRLRPVPRHLVLPAVLRALRADRRPEPARILVLPEPQRRRDQGPPDDVQGRADDLRLRLLAERLHHADPLALVLDVRAGPVRLSARAVTPGAGSGWTTTARSSRRSIGPASARVTTTRATSTRSSRRSSSAQDSKDPACLAAVRRRAATAPGDVGRHPRPAEVPGRRHVAVGGV